jgi:hypothetical protein
VGKTDKVRGKHHYVLLEIVYKALLEPIFLLGLRLDPYYLGRFANEVVWSQWWELMCSQLPWLRNV